MSRPARRLLCAAFVVAIWIPIVLLATGQVRVRTIENRPITPLPAVGGSALLHRSTYDDLNSYLTDRMPGRDRAVELRERLFRALFGESAGSQVVVGEHDWLYLSEVVHRACYSAADLVQVGADLNALQQAVTASGRRLRVLVPPQKEAAYPQHLPESERRTSCAAANTAGLRAATATAEPGYLPELLNVEADGLYYPNDTHWTGTGALIGARRLVESLQPGLFDTSAYRTQPGGDHHVGDLSLLAGLSSMVDADLVAIDRLGLTESTSELTSRPIPSVLDAHDGVPVVAGRTVVIHDSFGDALRPLASPWFAQAEWLSVPLDAEPTLFAGAMADADTVVLELTERNLPRVLPAVLSAAQALPRR